MSQTPDIGSLVGQWTYRQLSERCRSDDLVQRPAVRARHHRRRTRAHGRVQGTHLRPGWALTLNGSTSYGYPGVVRFQGRGLVGGEEWVYDYLGFVVPAWPNGINQCRRSRAPSSARCLMPAARAAWRRRAWSAPGSPSGKARCRRNPEMYHVAIVGAGPAGCAAAISLSRLDPELRVCLVSNGASLEMGQTLSPGAQQLLEQLGCWHSFLAAQFRPAYATRAAWGDQRPTIRTSSSACTATAGTSNGGDSMPGCEDACRRTSPCFAGAAAVTICH